MWLTKPFRTVRTPYTTAIPDPHEAIDFSLLGLEQKDSGTPLCRFQSGFLIAG